MITYLPLMSTTAKSPPEVRMYYSEDYGRWMVDRVSSHFVHRKSFTKKEKAENFVRKCSLEQVPLQKRQKSLRSTQ